jgi:hypothetical protein
MPLWLEQFLDPSLVPRIQSILKHNERTPPCQKPFLANFRKATVFRAIGKGSFISFFAKMNPPIHYVETQRRTTNLLCIMVNPNVSHIARLSLANGSRYWLEGSMLDSQADLTVRHGLVEPPGVTKGTVNTGFLGIGQDIACNRRVAAIP